MSLITYKFDLSITPNKAPPMLSLSQYDNSRVYIANLKNDKGEDFILPEGAVAELRGFNGNKVPFTLETTISGSTVTFTPKDALTDQPGRIYTTLNITSGSDLITPILIIFNVQKAGITKEQMYDIPTFVDTLSQIVETWLAQQNLHSPTVTVQNIEHGHRITFEDSSGTQTFDVLDGQNEYVLALEDKGNGLVRIYHTPRTQSND